MLENSKGTVVLIMEQSTVDTGNQQERLLDIAWLAGLWEGEGNFSVFRGSGNRIYAAASLPNTDFDLIEAIHLALQRLGVGHYINTRKLSQKNAKHADSKVVYVVGFKRVRALLDNIQAALRGRKREVAAVVRTYVERRLSLPKNAPYSAADIKTLEVVRSLNRKGPKESSETIR
jgi:hypothetical protein